MRLPGVLLALCLLFSAVGSAQPRVVDLRPGEEGRSSAGQWLEVGEAILFLANDERDSGSQLFRLDPEAERFERISTFCNPGVADQIRVLGRGTRRALISGSCPGEGHTYNWATDGTREGTNPFFPGTRIRILGTLPEDRVVLAVDRSPVQSEVWVTDGTEAGSWLLVDGFSSNFQTFGQELPGTSEPRSVVAFKAEHPSLGRGLWFSDGTSEGTRSIAVVAPGTPEPEIDWIGYLGSKVWFTTRTQGLGGLWVTDGTVAGSERVIESGPPARPDVSVPVRFATGVRKAYFVFETRFNGPEEIWVTDGTRAGSKRLSPLEEGGPSGRVLALSVWRDQAYFFAVGASIGHTGWWTSDGTPEGTAPVTAMPAGLPSPSFSLTQRGLFLGLTETNRESSVWIVDGNGGAPREVHRGNVALLANTDTEQYFGVRRPGAPYEIWVTDGSAVGTRRLYVYDNVEHSDPNVVALSGGKALWWALDDPYRGFGPYQLWMTEGSESSTRRLEFSGVRIPISSKPTSLVALGDRVALLVPDPSESAGRPSNQLFASDGTPEGTVDLVADPPVRLAAAQLFSALPGGRVLFLGREPPDLGVDTEAVWVADGRPGGTRKISTPGKISPSAGRWPMPDGALVAGDFFIPGSGSQRGLFRLFTDGRPTLTLLDDENLSSNDHSFVPLGAGVSVVAGGSLYWTNGSPAGTAKVTDRGLDWWLDFDGRLLFQTFGGQLWTYDGASSAVPFEADFSRRGSNFRVHSGSGIFVDSYPSRLSYFDGTATSEVASFSEIRSMVAFRGGVAFVAVADQFPELWFSDGTVAGTQRLSSVLPRRLGIVPEDLKVAGNRLFFTAYSSIHGRELWATDGTAVGTRMYDINPGLGSSLPEALTVAGRTLFFSAYDDTHGRELWSFDLGDGEGPLPPSGGWLSSPAIPGFRFQVRIAESTVGRLEPACLQETACVSGAVAGRPEIFLRVVGPRGNGFLWPTLVKFTTSQVEIWLEQTATGVVKYYSLDGARPGADELPARFDRLGFRPESAVGPAIVPVPMPAADRENSALPDTGPPPPAGITFFESPALPGYRVAVRITAGTSQPPVRRESACIAETLCVSGAVPGRSEVFVRVVGPKPNGFLWPTLARFTSSQVEVWIEQKATGARQYYLLPAASADSDDLTGLFDREGFVP
jgi:ELWxxDGT repeat protein